MPEDVIAACGDAVEPVLVLPQYERMLLEPRIKKAVAKKLPICRKILAAVAESVSLAPIVQTLNVTDHTQLMNADGMTARAGDQIRCCSVMPVSMFVFALSVSHKAEQSFFRKDIANPRFFKRLDTGFFRISVFEMC